MTTLIVVILFGVLETAYSSYQIIHENLNIANILDQSLNKGSTQITSGTGTPSDNPVDGNQNGEMQRDQQRAFIISVDSQKNYTFLQGQEVYSSFVSNNIDTLLSNVSGNIDNVFYKSKSTNTDVTIVAGTDQTIEINSIKQTIAFSSLAFLAGDLIVFFLSFLLSKMILKPIQKSQQTQKEFISNASHELKTPLTIIDANASILKNSNEDNKWVNNILNETKNMNSLIIDMISLASVEEQESPIEELDLSSTINNIALAFDAVCFENGIEYITNIQEKLIVKGNKKDFEKLTKILIDNAIKYVDSKGLIQVSLVKEKQIIYFSVYNSGCSLKDSEKDKIFNRFYRDEVSRDGESKQGSGLGLAILKEICDKYHYRVLLDFKENTYYKITIQI